MSGGLLLRSPFFRALFCGQNGKRQESGTSWEHGGRVRHMAREAPFNFHNFTSTSLEGHAIRSVLTLGAGNSLFLAVAID